MTKKSIFIMLALALFVALFVFFKLKTSTPISITPSKANIGAEYGPEKVKISKEEIRKQAQKDAKGVAKAVQFTPEETKLLVEKTQKIK